MTDELRLFEGDDEQRESAPLICRLDDLVEGESYTFNPPLHIAIVTMISKHATNKGYRHPNFMKRKIEYNGLKQGKLIRKGEISGHRTGTFTCEARFYNTYTKTMETMQYTVICKFSREQVVQGTVVDVRRAIDDAMSTGTEGGETTA